MKVGDYVGIAGTWDDEYGYELLGIIIDHDHVGRQVVYTIHGTFEHHSSCALEVLF